MRADATAPSTPAPPQRVGGCYELHHPLGRGGMGTVWQALDVRSGRLVAIKRLHQDSPESTRRLARELQALARLQHPNLVQVLDSGIGDDGAPYLVMELVQGTTLKHELERNGKLPPERVRDIALQVARALVAAHARGVVHRDLKPSNIMLSDVEGVDAVKLVDFGVAQLVDGSHASLTGSQFIGTPQYASPEQAQGHPTTARSDLYSLGVILYDALSGAPPFAAETPMGLLYHHVHSAPKPLSTELGGIPPWIQHLSLALLQKDPCARPASADEVLDCLLERRAPVPRSVMAAQFGAVSASTLDATIEADGLPGARQRSSRRIAIAGAALGLLLVGLSVRALQGMDRHSPPATSATTPMAAAVASAPPPDAPRSTLAANEAPDEATPKLDAAPAHSVGSADATPPSRAKPAAPSRRAAAPAAAKPDVTAWSRVAGPSGSSAAAAPPAVAPPPVAEPLLLKSKREQREAQHAPFSLPARGRVSP